MKIEIYINKQLCDLDSSNISMRFKRQFINPAELNTKDAQKSYSITFPATPRNNDIFSYKNVEEVSNKFGTIYDNVQVYIDSIKVFNGKFRLSEITSLSYKGNLGVPAPITVKDIFGDNTMSQAGEWIVPFTGIDDLTLYNNKQNSEAIFPIVLYGLLNKNPDNDNNYTSKTDYDDTVVLSLDNFPPSINVIQMLEQIFINAGYRLQGSALSDSRLNKLYVSYKNPNDFEPEWNAQKMEISGTWGKYKDGNIESKLSINEFEAYSNSEYPASFYCASINILNSKNKQVAYDMNNPHIITTEDNTIITIPNSGLYKVTFNSKIQVIDENVGSWSVPDLEGTDFEIKVVKHANVDNIQQEILSNSFYVKNQNQLPNNPNTTDIFPKNKGVNFIDTKHSATMICGFAWGARGSYNYTNPLATDKYNFMATKGAAINSLGYTYRNGTEANKYKIQLNNAPVNNITRSDDKNGSGDIATVVYLEKGDIITVVSSSFYESTHSYWYNHNIDFDLSIEPFRKEKDWLKINNEFNSFGAMDWNDSSNFLYDNINLIRFLPSNIKVNDWIDNFCKAFNLILTNKSDNIFSLDVKNRRIVTKVSNIIDLDKKANIHHRTNQPLDLPYLYDIGFTINENEEGYINTRITGGGLFRTGVADSKNVIEQRSNFSYTWLKDIIYKLDVTDTILKVPVITEHDIWENNSDDYEEMINTKYFDLSQRFWYKDYVKNIRLNDSKNIDIAFVKIEDDGIILDYENKQDSITRVYFLLLNNSKSYTIIDCFLSPDEYNKLDSSLIKFNGDLYHAAEIDGYDPTNKNVGTLKLIKRIV